MPLGWHGKGFAIHEDISRFDDVKSIWIEAAIKELRPETLRVTRASRPETLKRMVIVTKLYAPPLDS